MAEPDLTAELDAAEAIVTGRATAIPAAAIAAAAGALNAAHVKRGWNKPAPWWAEEIATAMLEAAAPFLAAKAGAETSYVCSGEAPLEHEGGNAGRPCTSQVFTRTERQKVSRAEVLAALAGEDGEAVCPKCGTSVCLEDKAADW